ncbi:unnamed protein product [Peronospora belbahrii]|uniref:Tyrosinase copper-binding domain-containing protein n=1 Tax=Peronospora belbahrii TaxID=622444 RepID=A0AAU9LEH6_9STRA|nr:unnamed protein product [Peronospora belbahrii]CAH0515098.1 unnamed protein product [Peronospora belbahrii]
MNLRWILKATFLVLVSTSAPIEAQEESTIPSTEAPEQCRRVRKDWDVLTPTEKNTYKRAIAAAMDSGAYIKFVEIHTEMQVEMEAHRTCMFCYWHRLLLVVFENMLRAQGPEFACVTLPYVNFVGAHDRVLAGTCSSLGDCLPILRELGGYTTGSQQTVNINGQEVSGRCATESPLDHFCQSGDVSGEDCVRCVPRSNWGVAEVPASASFASLREQIFSGQNIGQMSPLIEQGCHNNIHANLEGVMNTFAAPADPIFWSLHTMIDLFHVIFHKCRVGTEILTFDQKAAHPIAWTSCPKRNGGVFQPTDRIVMRTGVAGRNKINATDDPVIGRYFEGVPDQYAGLMDARDLGSGNSYSYEIRGHISELYVNCDRPTPATPIPDGDRRKLVAKTDKNIVEMVTQETKCDEEKQVSAWYDKTMDYLGGQTPEAMADLERQVCMYEEECQGGTHEYSAEFQATWGSKQPRCLTIVKAIKRGKMEMMHANWRQDMEIYFGCPKPANATRSRCSAKKH